MKLTNANIFTLAETFKTATTVSARVKASDFTHLQRCIALGLARVDGKMLVLTAEGAACIAERNAQTCRS
jgi:hypothetical protein